MYEYMVKPAGGLGPLFSRNFQYESRTSDGIGVTWLPEVLVKDCLFAMFAALKLAISAERNGSLVVENSAALPMFLSHPRPGQFAGPAQSPNP